MGYLQTENAQLLESILRDELMRKGLSASYVKNAIKGDRTPMNDIRRMIQWCQDGVKTYVEQKGALCKGELKTVGSIILSVNPYQFNEKILVRPIVDGKSLRDLLQEKGIGYELLTSLINDLNTPRILIYPEITDKKNVTWYAVHEEALKYVNDFLTILDDTELDNTEPAHSKKTIPRERKKIYALTGNIEEKKEEPAIMTPQIFLNKYGLENKPHMGHSPVIQMGLDKALFDAGIRDISDLIAIKRRIKRSPVLSDALMIPESDNYSREKLNNLATEYLIREPEERREFLKEIDTTFNIVIP